MNKEINAISVIDSKIKARTSFNKQYEIFKWEGNFEQYEVEFSSWLTYDNLTFSKEDYILEIRYIKRDTYEKYLEYLPDTVRLNGKHFFQSGIRCDNKYDLIENELKNFFEQGKSINHDLFDTKEILDVLIFGYFTYKRFIEFLKKHFPDFINECRKYSSEPTAKIMDIFKSPNLSAEELEIELKKAVRNEDYEKAALLRDKIKSLKSQSYNKPIV
ncbi:MAG: UvrB/UvrC motif-containing protein [Candidatus Kuenenia sp.]|nr:UvrB/UvrC motif-containing protein [Candidatus Kuenenia sp.]